MKYNRAQSLEIWNRAKTFDDILKLQAMFLRGQLLGTPDFAARLFPDTQPFVPYLIGLLDYEIISIGGQGPVVSSAKKVRGSYTTVKIPREFQKLPSFYCAIRQRQHLKLLVPKHLIPLMIKHAPSEWVIVSKNGVEQISPRKLLSKITVSQVRCDAIKSNVAARRWRNATSWRYYQNFAYFDPDMDYKPGQQFYPYIFANYDSVDIVDTDWQSNRNLAADILALVTRIAEETGQGLRRRDEA